MILAPNDHLLTPPVSMFVNRKGGRLRNELTRSGQRLLPKSDVMEVQGVLVTTPLRTACDLGRLLHRDSAFAALDAMLRLGAFDRDELCDAAGRAFAGCAAYVSSARWHPWPIGARSPKASPCCACVGST